MKTRATLTPSERYLLTVIAYLRGSACDAWARLNWIATRRKTGSKKESLKYALQKDADPEEIAVLEAWLRTQASGAGLPAVTPHLPNSVRIEQRVEFRRRVRKGYAAIKFEDPKPAATKKRKAR